MTAARKTPTARRRPDVDAVEPDLPISPADPAHFTISLDRDGLANLTDFALFDAVLTGGYPHGWGAQGPAAPLEALMEPEDMLRCFPDGAELVRSVAIGRLVEAIGRGEGYVAQLSRGQAWFMLRVAARTPEIAREVGGAIEVTMPRPVREVDDPAKVDVRLWQAGHYGVRSQVSTIIAQSWDEVADNYTAATRAQLADLMDVAPVDGELRAGRIVLITGPPGVGKTNVIKTLARAWSSWCVFESVQYPERVFSDPVHLDEILQASAPAASSDGDTRTFRALVLEDIDHFVSMDRTHGGEPAIGRLLNVSDGWTGSDNVLVVMTSNMASSQMHPAITRPGRCLADISFGLLKPKEAGRLLGSGTKAPRNEVSLAEVFDLRRRPTASAGVVDAALPGYL
ncbi:MAG: DUF5925 domain-containing protein [Actinomycetes bacterium]